MTEQPCKLVIQHEGVLGELKGILTRLTSDVEYIKMRVDDGLAVKVDRIDKDLSTSIAEGKVDAANLRSEDWLKRIVTGSVGKLIGLSVIYIIVITLTGTGFSLFVKEKYSQEMPGQQKQTLQKTTDIQSTLTGYHSHILIDGRTLLHTGDADKPAWVYDEKTNVWTKAPSMRTEVFDSKH
jgi:hypothetical protein